MKIVTWNVNGLRAILRKGFVEMVGEMGAEIICLQETKINQDLPMVLPGYVEYWGHGLRPGYSGTLILVREDIVGKIVRQVGEKDVGDGFLWEEGRLVALELEDFYLLNCYFPNGGQGEARLKYKDEYYREFLNLARGLETGEVGLETGRGGSEAKRGKPVIFCGDVNTAHTEIDLARPAANKKTTGFLPWERAWIDEVVGAGFVDAWRGKHPEKVAYTWWDYKTRARERDVGWRIDYFFVGAGVKRRVIGCEILSEVYGSDHAPVMLELK